MTNGELKPTLFPAFTSEYLATIIIMSICQSEDSSKRKEIKLKFPFSLLNFMNVAYEQVVNPQTRN